MSRNRNIEEILELWFELITCAPNRKAEVRERRDAKILQIIGEKPYTIDQVLSHLHSQFQDYRRDQKMREKLSGGQQAPKKPQED